jgi:hypothetical protein
MSRMLVATAAILTTISLSTTPDLLAQTRAKERVDQEILRSQTNRTTEAIHNQTRQATQHIEGRVKSVDRTGTRLTLEDGTTLTIPKTVQTSGDARKPGVTVSVEYQENDGEKVVTSIQVKPRPRS